MNYDRQCFIIDYVALITQDKMESIMNYDCQCFIIMLH